MFDEKKQMQPISETAAADIHDRVAEAYYGLMGQQFMRETQNRIHWICRQIQGKSVLDVGCSQGIVPILLARDGLKVIGIDSSPKSIDEANHYLAQEPEHVQRNVSFVNTDFLSWDFDDVKIDTVVMSEVLEHLTRPDSFLETAARILAKGGRLTVTVPFGINDFIDHKHTFYLLEPLRLISKHFDLVDIEILGKWLGIVADRRVGTDRETETFRPTIALMEKLERAFYQTERVLRDELSRTRKKQDEASKNYRGATEQVAILTQRVTQEEAARQTAEQARVQATTQLEQVQRSLQEERTALQQQLAQSMAEGQAKTVAMHEAEKKLIRLETEREAMRSRLEEANHKYRLATEQVTALSQRVAHVEMAHQLAEQASIQTTADLDHVQKHFTEQGTILQKRTAQLKEHEGRIQELTSSLSAANDRVSQCERHVLNLEKQVTEGEARKGELAALMTAAKNEEVRRCNAGSQALKDLVQAERLREQAEHRRDIVQRFLSYRLGSILADKKRNPMTWIAVPWLLWRERSAFLAERKLQRPSLPAPEVWRRASLTEPWRTASVLAKRSSHWVAIEVGGYVVVRLDLRVQSFSEVSDRGVMLWVRAMDAAGNLLPIADGRFKALAGEQNVFFAPLSVGVDVKHSVEIQVPSGAAWLFVSVNRYKDKSLARIVYESIIPSQQLTGVSTVTSHEEHSIRSISKAFTEKSTEPIEGLHALPPATWTVPRSLRILSLLDKFSEDCFSFEATLIALDRKNWRSQICDSKADLLLAESVWRGNNGTWNYCMTKLSSSHGQDLRDVLALCREQGIPTVFWNKEDPANFDLFIEAAKLFDHVFTTDSDCIPRYQKILGHSRVYLLPFAAQPAMHSPVLAEDRNARVAFAGSWNGRKYPERARWLDILFSEPLRRGILDIYDRYAGSAEANLGFPEKYQSALHDSLPYCEIAERVYKRYVAMINVNSVGDSPSMVARRIFELAACGTPIISSPSPALTGEFSRAVDIVQKEDDVRRVLDEILRDELNGLRRGVYGVRIVHSAHTYSHRVEKIRKVLGMPFKESSPEAVTAICVSKRPNLIGQIAAILNAQTHPDIRVIFVAHGDGFSENAILKAFNPRLAVRILRLNGHGTVLADGLNLAMEHSTTAILAKFDDDDYYGPNYLLDAILAFRFTDAALVGKNSYFCFLERCNKMALRFPSMHYRYTKLVHGATLVWNRRHTGDLAFTRVRQGTDTAFLTNLTQRNLRVFSSDPFNFVHVRYANPVEHTWKIGDDEFLTKARVVGEGLNLSRAYL